MIARLFAHFRVRRAIKALAHYSEAKDAYRSAVVSGDRRLQHHTLRAVEAAMTARLKAERALILNRR